MKVNMVIMKPDGSEERREGIDAPTYTDLKTILGGPVVQLPAIKTWDGVACAAFTNSDAVHESGMVIVIKAEDKNEPLVRH